MADISSYTHKWRATTNADHRSEGSKVTKRNRQPVSCQPCRTRKLKCDRGHPCDSCSKRGDEDACYYAKVVVPFASTAQRKDESRIASSKAQDKLKHLEELVIQMLEPQSAVKVSELPSPPSAQDSPSEGTLSRELDGKSATYAGGTHWSAILDHIHELKNELGSDAAKHDAHTGDNDLNQPDSLFGAPRPPSLQYVLQSYLPAKIHVDRRLSQYFNAKYMILPSVHMGQFQRQYERFWVDPPNTSPLWVSILFSMCCLGASLSVIAGSEPGSPTEAMEVRDSFMMASAQCLVLGNYSKPQPYVVEALSMFLQCKYVKTTDPSREIALVLSIQTRLAYLMGYHRDASNFPNRFTPFEAEMRRRTWAMLKQFDLMISFQLGVPNTVPPLSWDTANPSNLLDTDFDEDTKEMPPNRPETEATQILYFSVKARLMTIYGMICQHALSFPATPPSQSEIMDLDAQIRQAAKSVPAILRFRPMSQSFADPSYLIMVRYNLTALVQKSLCVLHRKYMANGDNEYSYRACLESSTGLCKNIISMYPEYQPGGFFGKDRWMLTSFNVIDFLLACMVLCLSLSISRKKYVNRGGDPQKWLQDPETLDNLDTLRQSQAICVDWGATSKEARRVAGAVATMLAKLTTKEQGPAAGADGARYFLNMTGVGGGGGGTTADSRQTASDDHMSLNLTPLSLAENPATTTAATASISPSNLAQSSTPSTNHSHFSTDPSSYTTGTFSDTSPADQGTTNRSSNANTDTASPLYSNTNASLTSPPASFTNSYNFNAFVLDTGADPTAPAFDMDLDSFANLVDGPEQAVDWFQLDQFAGVYGGLDWNVGGPAAGATAGMNSGDGNGLGPRERGW